MYSTSVALFHRLVLTLFKTDESVAGLKVTKTFFTSKGATRVVAVTLRLGVSSNVGTEQQTNKQTNKSYNV